MADPLSYEIINPLDFGVERHIQMAHRLTGWNAMQHRAQKLGLTVHDDLIKAATKMIKNLADKHTITMNQLDQVLIQLAHHHLAVSSSDLEVQAKDLPPELQETSAGAVEAMRQYENALAMLAVKAIQNEVSAVSVSL